MLSGAKIISACPVEPSKIPSERSNAGISTLRIIIEDETANEGRGRKENKECLRSKRAGKEIP